MCVRMFVLSWCISTTHSSDVVFVVFTALFVIIAVVLFVIIAVVFSLYFFNRSHLSLNSS